MKVFKDSFFRFFAFGFAAGAALVFTTLDGPISDDIAKGVVPVAEAAAPAR